MATAHVPPRLRPPVALRPLRRRARRRRRRRPRRVRRPGADVADRPRHGRRRRRGARGGPRARAALLARRRAVERLGRVRGPARVRLRAAPRRSGAARDARRLPRRPRAPDLGDGRPARGARLPARPLRRCGRARPPAGRSGARTWPTPCSPTRTTPPGCAAEGIEGKDTLFPPYLVPGAVAYVARSRPTVEDAIAVIHAAGGVAVWAHPFWDIADRDTVLAAIDALRRRRARRRRGVLRRRTTRSRRARSTRPSPSAGCWRRARPTSTARSTGGSAASARFELYGLEPRLGPIAG